MTSHHTSFQFALSGEAQTEYNHFNTLKGMQIAAIQNGQSDADLVANNLTSLTQLATAGDYYASAQAQNLLNELNGMNYLPAVTLPTVGQQNLVAPPLGSGTVAGTNQVVAVPNPAKHQTTFHYSIDEGSVSPRIVVKSLDGRTVWGIDLQEGIGQIAWDFGSTTDGIYLFSLELGGKAVTTEKLVIVH